MRKLIVLGTLIATGVLPVACGSDDDDDGGASGKGGKAGSSGKGGKAGTGGSTAGTGGSTAGSAGKAGGSTGGGAGKSNASGGKPGGGAGSGATGGAGGAPEGGAGGTPEGAGQGGQAGEAGAAGAAGERPKAQSGFDSNPDGWKITGDAQASSFEPDYNGMGGNPDGLISAVDDVAGGVWFFTAPSKYLGDASRFYGTHIEFDLKVTAITSAFSSPDVILEGAGIVAAYDCTPDPGIDWTSFSVPLSEAGWTLTSLSGEPLTADQFKSILADLTAFRIRGEFNTGSDTGSLDNVKFGAAD